MQSMLRYGLAVCLSALLGTVTAAAAYPERTVELVVPFSPGSSPDVVARHIGQALSERLGQPFVVVNRGGAGGAVGASAVARAPADGYTVFFMVNSIVTMNQFIYKSLDYDPRQDFTPVSTVADVPYVLLANKDFKQKSLKDLLTYAKAHPDEIDYASAGVGGAGHITMELLSSLAGVHLTHVPYGTGNPLLDVVAGQVPLIVQPTTTALEQIRQGTVFGLGVTSERLPQLPDVPSIAEVVPGYAADGWQGVMVRAGTPEAIVDTLNGELRAVLALPKTKALFEKLGIRPHGSTPEEMRTRIDADAQKWGDVIRSAGIAAK